MFCSVFLESQINRSLELSVFFNFFFNSEKELLSNCFFSLRLTVKACSVRDGVRGIREE